MNSQMCSGCSACMACCPVRAISMAEDQEGFLIPQVDETHCVNCGKCIRVCPALSVKRDNDRSPAERAYAARWPAPERSGSASGAFFPALAKYVLEEKSGYVCGCVLDQLQVKHIVTNQWPGVLRMQDSKYVQSDMGTCISRVLSLLQENQWVLFSGTSCQVAGVKAAANTQHIQTETLITVDFFCHGVPSPLVWRTYLRFYEKERHKQITGYRFRSKKYGWGSAARGSCHMNTVLMEKRADNITYLSRLWKSIFFSNLCIRLYCHTCPYASVHKPADITMGDFWGIEDILPEFDDGKGTSVVITRTAKGENILSELCNLEKQPVTVEDAVRQQGNAFVPSQPHLQRAEFWRDFHQLPFSEMAKRYFYYDASHRVKGLIKRVLFALHLRNIN